jgi:hypothetical protein
VAPIWALLLAPFSALFTSVMQQHESVQ